MGDPHIVIPSSFSYSSMDPVDVFLQNTENLDDYVFQFNSDGSVVILKIKEGMDETPTPVITIGPPKCINWREVNKRYNDAISKNNHELIGDNQFCEEKKIDNLDTCNTCDDLDVCQDFSPNLIEQNAASFYMWENLFVDSSSDFTDTSSIYDDPPVFDEESVSPSDRSSSHAFHKISHLGVEYASPILLDYFRKRDNKYLDPYCNLLPPCDASTYDSGDSNLFIIDDVGTHHYDHRFKIEICVVRSCSQIYDILVLSAIKFINWNDPQLFRLLIYGEDGNCHVFVYYLCIFFCCYFLVNMYHIFTSLLYFLCPHFYLRIH